MVTLEKRQKASRMIQSLQNSRDYAAPEMVPYLTAAIEHLLDMVEPEDTDVDCEGQGASGKTEGA